MSWVKSEVIAGHQVTVAVLWKYGTDPQYDHTVSVVKIGTNHGPRDANYYGDDVLYFDDHGVYILGAGGFPAIPPGSGTDNSGCTPYIFGYTFDSLAKTRSEASAPKAQAYSIVIPGVLTDTSTGGDGYKGTIPITGHNYGFSVSGAIDNSKGGPYLMPIQLSILPPGTYTNGVANPQDPLAGWQYENSMIGTSRMGNSCINTPPQYWMNPLPLTVSGLTPGVLYNLYEFDFNGIAGPGSAAALNVPTDRFNYNYKHSSAKPKRTQFTATKTTYSQTVTTTSDKIVVFRAVPASAP